jgi:hypothetical protein
MPLPPPTVHAGTIEAIALLRDLPTQASRNGAGALSVVASGEAIENDWLGAFVDVPKGACLLAYARGAASIEDVDVVVYSDEGAVLGADEARDAHPTVVLCSLPADRVYVAARTVAGEGFVAVGAQLVSVDRSLVVARALGARGLVGDEVLTDGGAPSVEALLRDHRVRLGGTWEEIRREDVALDARAPTIVGLPLETGGCIDAAVIPAEVGGPLDIEAFDEFARVVARAHNGLGARSLTVCASFATQGSLRVRPHVGEGRAAIVLSRARPEHIDDLRVRPEIAWVGANQPLDRARAERDQALATRGYPPARLATTGVLSLGRRVSIPLDIRSIGDACARVDVVAGAPLAWMDGHVWNDGGLLSSGNASGSLVLFACARGVPNLELEALGRPGPFAVLVRSERWRDPAFASLPLAASRLLQDAAGGPDGIPDSGQARVRRLALEQARVVGWAEIIAPARCVRVTVAVQGEGAGVDLQAVDSGDETVLDRAESAEAASVRACARGEVQRRVRFEARASAGRLDALVGETSEGG